MIKHKTIYDHLLTTGAVAYSNTSTRCSAVINNRPVTLLVTGDEQTATTVSLYVADALEAYGIVSLQDQGERWHRVGGCCLGTFSELNERLLNFADVGL